MNPLLNTLQALERELHHPGMRSNRARLEQLLHPQFHEVGRSGRSYTRETVIGFLAAVQQHAQVQAEAYALAELAPGVALLTYRSAQVQAKGDLALPTHRSSLWLLGPAGWQLRYHQGTPADTAT